MDLPASEHREEFFVLESPRSTCTPSSTSGSGYMFTFPVVDAIEEDAHAQRQSSGPGETSQGAETWHTQTERTQRTVTSQQVVIVPEMAAIAQSAPAQDSGAKRDVITLDDVTTSESTTDDVIGAEGPVLDARPEPAKKQRSQEEDEFIKAAQFEIDALVISLDTSTSENWSETATENGSEMGEESDADSVALDIRQLKEFDVKRGSVPALTEITMVQSPSQASITEAPVEAEVAMTAEQAPDSGLSDSLLLPPTSSSGLTDRPRSPWHHVETEAPEDPTERIVSLDSSSLVVSQSVVTQVTDTGSSPDAITLQLPVQERPLPVELPQEDVEDDPELVTAFNEPDDTTTTTTKKESSGLSLKPQWMVRPTSPWAKENLQKQTSRTDPSHDAPDAESRPSGRESPKLFEYSSSSDGHDETKLPSFGAAVGATATTVQAHVATTSQPITQQFVTIEQEQEKEKESKDSTTAQGQNIDDDYIIVDPQELLREGDIFGDTETPSESQSHTQSETFSDYDINFETLEQTMTSELSSVPSVAPPTTGTGSDLAQTGSSRTGSVPEKPSIQVEPQDGDSEDDDLDLEGEVDFSQEFASLDQELAEEGHTATEESGFSLKPQWLVRPSSPWSHDKMVEMSHPHEHEQEPMGAHQSDSSPRIPPEAEPSDASLVTLQQMSSSHGSSQLQELTSDSKPQKASSTPEAMMSSTDTFQTLESSGAESTSTLQMTGSSDTLDYDADEEISSGSEVLQTLEQGTV